MVGNRRCGGSTISHLFSSLTGQESVCSRISHEVCFVIFAPLWAQSIARNVIRDLIAKFHTNAWSYWFITQELELTYAFLWRWRTYDDASPFSPKAALGRRSGGGN